MKDQTPVLFMNFQQRSKTMDDWIKEAKERARQEAEDFIALLNEVAEELNIEREWFIEETIKNVHQLKSKVE